MDSSTSRLVLSNRGRLVLLGVLIVGTPLVWLTLLETAYVLAYQACADRSNTSVHVAEAVALGVTVSLTVIAWTNYRPSQTRPQPIGFLGGAALLLTLLMLIVVLASGIGPLLLHPCD
jgi:hypothetical protein